MGAKFYFLILLLMNATSWAQTYRRSYTIAETAPAVNGAGCANCSVAREELSYESCGRNNSYLQPMLKSLIDDARSPIAEIERETVPQYIKMSCVQQSLMSFPNSNQYKVCRMGDSRPSATKKRPCVSEEYVDVTGKSFNIAAECLGGYVTGNESNKSAVAQAMFSLMTHESGLHANVQSPTGAAGSGQLVKGAIEVVNHSELTKMIRHSSENGSLVSKNPACGQLLPKLLRQPMKGTRPRQCERMSLFDGNPLKNMAYTFANVRLNYVSLQKAVFKNPVFEEVFSDLTSAERTQLQLILSSWAHNTGAAGMRKPLLRAVFAYAHEGRKVTSVDEFTEELSKILYRFPHPANSSKARRQETSQFYPHIHDRSKKIANQAGGSCLNQ